MLAALTWPGSCPRVAVRYRCRPLLMAHLMALDLDYGFRRALESLDFLMLLRSMRALRILSTCDSTVPDRQPVFDVLPLLQPQPCIRHASLHNPPWPQNSHHPRALHQILKPPWKLPSLYYYFQGSLSA